MPINLCNIIQLFDDHTYLDLSASECFVESHLRRRVYERSKSKIAAKIQITDDENDDYMEEEWSVDEDFEQEKEENLGLCHAGQLVWVELAHSHWPAIIININDQKVALNGKSSKSIPHSNLIICLSNNSNVV